MRVVRGLGNAHLELWAYLRRRVVRRRGSVTDVAGRPMYS